MHKLQKTEVSDLPFFEGKYGCVVWGKVKGSPWWPGVIVAGMDCGLPEVPGKFAWVFWFKDNRVSKVQRNWIGDFVTHFNKFFSVNKQRVYLDGVIQAIQAIADCWGLDREYWTNKRTVTWAKDGFPSPPDKKASTMSIPPDVVVALRKIRNYNLSCEEQKPLNSQSAESENSEEKNKRRSNNGESSDSSSLQLQPTSDLERVKSGELDIKEICLGCRRKKDEYALQHPYFLGLICNICKENLKEGVFSFGDDGIHTHCAICGCLGQVFVCSNEDCCKVYCYQCIELLAASGAKEIILRKNPWDCFICETSKTSLNGHIKPRSKSEICEKITLLFSTGRKPTIPKEKSEYGVRVLSLFDGIGTGMVVLKKLGIKVEKYFACEIEQDAINVSIFNHGDSIIHIGDVTKLTEDKITALGNIDLLIGGSPCTELSLVNPARKGLFSTDGTGCLFFDFYRVLSILRKYGPIFWLFENTAAMPRSTRETITRFLECDPAVIDASWLSAQHRARLFWGNIPGLGTTMITDMNIKLNNCLESNFKREALVEKIRTVTTSSNSLRQGKNGHAVKIGDEKMGNLLITELETVFGFPLHYTDSGNINLNRRRQLLGKSWSVPVIEHIMRPLKLYFSCEEEKKKSLKRKRNSVS